MQSTGISAVYYRLVTDAQMELFPLRFRDVPVSDLRFDTHNPRLPAYVARTDADILRWMLEDARLLDLMGSIGAQGYFPGEPLLVTPEIEGGEANPPFVVVEGNRRLAAVRLLLHPEEAAVRGQSVAAVSADAAFRPEALPCLVYETRDSILDYLGYRHVTGIQQWSPLAKAQYVAQLLARFTRDDEPEDLRAVAKRIGSRADYVRRLLTSLRVYQQILDKAFFGLRGVEEQSIDFSVLTTALSYAQIAEWLGLRETPDGVAGAAAEANLRDLVDWLFRERTSGQTLLGESRNLRLLAAVVDHPEAVAALRAGESLVDAAQLTEEVTEQFSAALRQARERLQRARLLADRVDPLTEQHRALIAELRLAAEDLSSIARGRQERDLTKP